MIGTMYLLTFLIAAQSPTTCEPPLEPLRNQDVERMEPNVGGLFGECLVDTETVDVPPETVSRYRGYVGLRGRG
jgi:hypothetical protein